MATTEHHQRPLDRLKIRRLERMRLGQSVCAIEHLLSDPEFRVALVPLTEPEFYNSIEEANLILAEPNALEMAKREEIQRLVVLRHSCRNPDDLTEHFFHSVDEILAHDSPIEAIDVNHLFDCYLEMTHAMSPSIEELGEEEFVELKKVWQTIDWNELSGTQWYAAKRFVNSIYPNLLKASAPGYFSTRTATTKSDSETSALTATGSQTSDDAKSAEPS